MKASLKYIVNLRRNRSQTALIRRLKDSLATWTVAIVLSFLGPPIAAQKVKIDYDKATDFSKFKTYAWVQGTPVMDPRLDAYIKKSLNDMFHHIGMNETSVSTADIVVTYHAAIGTDLSVGTALDPTFAASGGVAIPGQGIWQTAGGAAATHVNKGSLAFEILDRAANRPIWTGTAQNSVSDKPSERWGQVQKALDKLFRTFPPIPQKGASAPQ